MGRIITAVLMVAGLSALVLGLGNRSPEKKVGRIRVKTMVNLKVLNPSGYSFKYTKQASVIKFKKGVKYNVSIFTDIVPPLVILFSSPPAKNDPNQGPNADLWRPLFKQINSKNTFSIDPSEWKYQGDVVLTLWVDPLDKAKGSSVPTDLFEYVKSDEVDGSLEYVFTDPHNSKSYSARISIAPIADGG